MPKRPGSVTFVAVLTYINGVLSIVGGAIVLFTRDSMARTDDAGALAGITTSAILSIVIGIVVLLVARGLLNGNTFSRAVVTIVMVISVLNGILQLFTQQLVGGVVEILWAFLVLSLLFTARANEFFHARPSA
ncbi:hypothetical protein O159_20880 [Leifsonia xyli subsp. cynodontis DSM 46306]|uniref:DUF7144 domain-containing protein n=1 Tax=Leifsonia xyli subsp. cynodontis DSM 46306 TaxID=1389489 RepID=U3P6Z8_LEIXC|nr:hypothetical protein [Leifsonia xyli]AGW42070.1 hypothetical protein O159_20880 [Leifsonia xyli subsp. cynodontis DSM 46306]